ncbi:hypothetical protein FQA47_004615 [Oryzias melastigma]|uniref:Uncharacterized protein n=1 Tax=Oryzias melastigma TaxID=30732 RepID=A0A834CN90_ORYME|nr:hypothetical protein FQA47_004615 [Oryzias melastigma]
MASSAFMSVQPLISDHQQKSNKFSLSHSSQTHQFMTWGKNVSARQSRLSRWFNTWNLFQKLSASFPLNSQPLLSLSGLSKVDTDASEQHSALTVSQTRPG